jgi:hypothetical protein
MALLTYVKMVLEAYYTPDSAAMGFTAGRNIVTNAQCHVNQNYVLNLDLKDFFPSVHQARVWKRLQLKPFRFSQDIASVIAGLCCMKVTEQDGTSKYVLPQGAPTSPLLTNAICESMDKKLRGLARRFGLNYSRYADDMTFSSNHDVYRENGDFMCELHRIISDCGFTVNPSKTRLQKHGSRQEVTGLIVGERANVSRQYVKTLRVIIHHIAINDHPTRHDVSVAKGKLNYLRMVKGKHDSTYITLLVKLKQAVAGYQGADIAAQIRRDEADEHGGHGDEHAPRDGEAVHP